MIWIATLASAATPADLAAAAPEARAQLALCARDGCEPRVGAEAAWLLALHTYQSEGVADGTLAATVRALDSELFAALPPVLQSAPGEPQGWTRAPLAPGVMLHVLWVRSEDAGLLRSLSASAIEDPVAVEAAAWLIGEVEDERWTGRLADAWLVSQDGSPAELTVGFQRPVATWEPRDEQGDRRVTVDWPVTIGWQVEAVPRRDASAVNVRGHFSWTPTKDLVLLPDAAVQQDCAGEVAVGGPLTEIPCTDGLALFVSAQATGGRDPTLIAASASAARDARLAVVDLESRRARLRALRQMVTR